MELVGGGLTTGVELLLLPAARPNLSIWPAFLRVIMEIIRDPVLLPVQPHLGTGNPSGHQRGPNRANCTLTWVLCNLGRGDVDGLLFCVPEGLVSP